MSEEVKNNGDINENKKNKPTRWIDDDYEDAVQPMLRASNAIHAPYILLVILFSPFILIALILVSPLLAWYGVVELLFEPLCRNQKVQEQASKTALTVTTARNILYQSGIGSDNLACIFLTRTARMSHKLLGTFPKMTGHIFDVAFHA